MYSSVLKQYVHVFNYLLILKHKLHSAILVLSTYRFLKKSLSERERAIKAVTMLYCELDLLSLLTHLVNEACQRGTNTKKMCESYIYELYLKSFLAVERGDDIYRELNVSV